MWERARKQNAQPLPAIGLSRSSRRVNTPASSRSSASRALWREAMRLPRPEIDSATAGAPARSGTAIASDMISGMSAGRLKVNRPGF